MTRSTLSSFGPACTLGEGPLWHPLREQLFWFDIPKGLLICSNILGGQQRQWNFGEPASAAGWIDEDTLVVATSSGLHRFDIASGRWDTIAGLEAQNDSTRSNDGRIAPDGSFWIGTMACDLAAKKGAFYRYHAGSMTQLIGSVSVPNATCFSPDGRTAYLADTFNQIIWKWALDENGAPMGEYETHIDLRGDNLNPDGAVCDSEGYLWNAQWGASRVARYAPDGTLDSTIELPVSQPTCPAFGGNDLKTLYVTSAKEGLSAAELEKQPDAGKVFMISVDVPGLAEHPFKG